MSHRLIELFGDFHEPVPGILRRLSLAEPPYFAPIDEVTPQSWVNGPVVLIGDAAHATSPNMAQGAAMAMEDALILAEVLASGTSGRRVSDRVRGQASAEGSVGTAADASARPHEESPTDDP